MKDGHDLSEEPCSGGLTSAQPLGRVLRFPDGSAVDDTLPHRRQDLRAVRRSPRTSRISLQLLPEGARPARGHHRQGEQFQRPSAILAQAGKCDEQIVLFKNPTNLSYIAA